MSASTTTQQQRIVIGGDRNNVIRGGTGNDTLTGGAGSDTFEIKWGGGSDTITDFEAGVDGDKLKILDYGIQSLAALSLVTKQNDKDTVITFSSGEKLTLKNVVATSLVAENLVFTDASSGSTTQSPFSTQPIYADTSASFVSETLPNTSLFLQSGKSSSWLATSTRGTRSPELRETIRYRRKSMT